MASLLWGKVLAGVPLDAAGTLGGLTVGDGVLAVLVVLFAANAALGVYHLVRNLYFLHAIHKQEERLNQAQPQPR